MKTNKIKLYSSDYIIIGKEGPLNFMVGGDIAIYGDKEEAINDTREGEKVVACTNTTKEIQELLIKQITEYNL